MNIDNGKLIENFNDIPEFYKEIINVITTTYGPLDNVTTTT